MYELIAENNNWWFEWKNNAIIEDKVKWMDIFSSSFHPEFDLKKVGYYAKK